MKTQTPYEEFNLEIPENFPEKMIWAQILSSPGEQVIATENNG